MPYKKSYRDFEGIPSATATPICLTYYFDQITAQQDYAFQSSLNFELSGQTLNQTPKPEMLVDL